MANWLRITLYILLGMALMYIILKLLSKMPDKSDQTTAAAKTLLLSVQFYNLTRTNEFRELAKMPEFTTLLETLTEDTLASVSQSMV
jgi:predicted membrane channel-forming protein YqfA (hemolysin III family)